MNAITRRLRDDDGISLVEILVGALIIGIALAAFASTLVQSLSVVTRDEQLVRGNQFAAELIEATRNLDFESDLGFNSSPTPPPTTSEGLPTVILDAPSTLAPVPSDTINRDGIDYDVTWEIGWIDDPVEPGTENFKRVRINLDWSVRGRPFTTATAATRFDTPQEVTPCDPHTIVSMDVSPDFVRINSEGTTTERVTVTVVTCSPFSGVTLTPRPLAQRNMVADAASNGTIWRIDDFPAGTTDFIPGRYEWTADATPAAVATPDSVTVPVQFVQESTALLEIVGITLDPAALCVDATTGSLATDTVVTAQVTGAGNEDTVEISWTQTAGGDDAILTGAVDGDALFSSTIPAGHLFTAETTTITVSVTRTLDGLNVVQSFVLPITVCV